MRYDIAHTRKKVRWQSGRMRCLGKAVYEQSYRGFESLPHRTRRLKQFGKLFQNVG